MKIQPVNFPPNFLFGVATSAYQVEGAASEDGRAPSIWDRYAHTPGKVHGGDHADVSTDMYHRYPEDIALLRGMGARAYRFSVSWPRILPAGIGKANERGLDFYDRLVDSLLKAGIEPWVTLFHWDLPQALQDQYGGWLSRQIVEDFADYCTLVVKRLGDRVKHFLTINEFVCFIDYGYAAPGDPCFAAPGLSVTRKQRNQARHHALLAHGRAVQAIRSARSGLEVGLAENSLVCCPLLEEPESLAAAKTAMRHQNAHFLTAILEGDYLPEYLEQEGSDAPDFSAEDMKIIHEPLDFVGLNVYTAALVQPSAAPPGFKAVPFAAHHPKFGMDWLNFWPDSVYWAARHLSEIWGVRRVFITENGCAENDGQSDPVNGEVLDTSRVVYLREHSRAAARAVAEGWPLQGIFFWSLMDNFEWACGFSRRFGLIHVDYKTLRRTPKLSAQFFQRLATTRMIP
jgi:beta-glucosidase